MEQRIARLEEQVMTLQRERSEDHEDIRYIRKGVEEIRTQIAAMRLCPAPGTCVSLQGSAQDHERRIVTLEQTKAMAAGGLGLMRFAFILFGGGIGAIITYILTHHAK